MAITTGDTDWTDNGGSTDNEVVVSKPNDLADDDVVGIAVYNENNNAITWPTDFVEQESVFNNTDSDDMRLAFATKVITDASGEPSTYTVSWSGNTFVGGVIFALHGVDTADILAGTLQSASGSSGTINAPSMTTDEANALVVVIMSNYDWSTMPNPSGTTALVSTLSGGFESIQVHYFTQATAGATGNKTVSISSSNWVGMQIAFKPLATTHDLTANDVTATPAVDSPAIGQTHSLTANDIGSTPALDSPAMTQVHALVADDLTSASTLDTPTAAETHVLAADDLATASAVETAVLGQIHNLTADDVAAIPALDTPSIGQAHALTGSDLTATPAVDSPDITQTHALGATDVTATPSVETAVLGQAHNLTASNITATPALDTPTTTQTHVLAANDLVSATTASTPVLGVGAVNLTADDLTVSAIVETAVLGQVHGLLANDLIATPALDTPTLGGGVDALRSYSVNTRDFVTTLDTRTLVHAAQQRPFVYEAEEVP